ncbi:MAG: hypothetical protein QOI04_2055 [Verrucomicrobiota bacterium]|jgi:hypothetical protein
MCATTGEARNRAPDFLDARKLARTIRTFVKETARTFTDWKWKIVRSLFIADAKIDTRRAPFITVRQNSFPASAKLGEQMRELVTKCSVYFCGMFAQSRIERDQFVSEVSAAGAAF